MRLKRIAKDLLKKILVLPYRRIQKRRRKAFIERRINAGCFPSLPGLQNTHPRYIVTMTSYGSRINNTAPFTIFSLFSQSVLPDGIVLWLAENDRGKAGDLLEKLTAKGLEILYCEDLRSYKKLLPALVKYPDDILITADDDVYYPSTWFDRLKTAYLSNPLNICCHRAHEIVLNNGIPVPYKEWKFMVSTTKHENRLFPTGVGGVLYPPRSLSPLCAESNEYLKLAPNSDDIWFWAMARLKGTKYTLIKNGYAKRMDDIDPEESDKGLYAENLNNGKNDWQIEAVLKRFPEIHLD